MSFEKYPSIRVEGYDNSCTSGWEDIISTLKSKISSTQKNKMVVVIECYQGTFYEDLFELVKNSLDYNHLTHAADLMLSEERILQLTQPDVTDDRVFGYLSRLNMEDFFDTDQLISKKNEILNISTGTIIIFGHGASLLSDNADLIIYADMARWEIQQRMRANKVDNLGISNREEKFELQYKRAYFVDWRVCDRLKKKLMNKWDYVLDTNDHNNPKLVKGEAINEGLSQAMNQPFSLVPFFDPGPWGGQWMREVFGLEKEPDNFAWCFNCVPEENSLLLKFGQHMVEIPSINLVFMHPRELLGDAVHARFGDEFPIRFDFLDTMDGGNLSLQVHPLTEYIQEKFGMHYTQDESYYMMDAKPGAKVYLGLKDGIESSEMMHNLEKAEREGIHFNAEKYAESWDAKKHDHFLIPGGTVHCSGKDSMVLEISSTPYIFTFKLWDWGRVGLDGKPRPINVKHGKNVIQWNRTTAWTKANLVNQFEEIAQGEGWREEKTGLHKREFIETRRHWFNTKVSHNTNGGVNVLCLVEGSEIIVESPSNAFNPFIVHYAETFVIPASVNEYTIRPYGKSKGKEIATIKAYVRTNS